MREHGYPYGLAVAAAIVTVVIAGLVVHSFLAGLLVAVAFGLAAAVAGRFLLRPASTPIPQRTQRTRTHA
jgi:hypothetical protein